MVKAAVIVPAHNAAKYLPECLASIKAQTLPPVQVIVVDDGSTDGTASILQDFAAAQPHIKVISTQNRGMSAARNTALDNLDPDVTHICFVDADDVLGADALTVLARGVRSTGADIVMGAFSRKPLPRSKSDATEAHAPKRLHDSIDFKTYTPEQALCLTLYQKGFDNGPWAKLYDRRLFDKGLRYTPGLWYEDLEITPRLWLAANKIAKTNYPLYYYRPNPAGIMNTWEARRFAVLQITRQIEHRLTYDRRLYEAALDRRFAAACNMYRLTVRLGKTKGQQTGLPQMWQIIKARRMRVLLNPHSRIKNHAGALAALLGQSVFKALCRIF